MNQRLKAWSGVIFAVFFAAIPELCVCSEPTEENAELPEDINASEDLDSMQSVEVPLISDREWNKSGKLWIARAMVSEAGWDETADHVAIAYVLYRRWVQVKRKFPRFPIRAVVARYCAGFGKTVYFARQKWVRNLNEDGKRPKGWPDDIAWSDYKDRWLSVLKTADEWRQGIHLDPCRGISRYWGGPMDKPSKRMIRMDCGKTKNYFYTVRNLLLEAEVNSSFPK
jgi:hypothetical protein